VNVKHSRRFYWIALLGFGSGFSLLFPSQILMTWMLDSGCALEKVGWVSCLALPYLCSFIWMPAIDYLTQHGVVSRRLLMVLNFLLYSVLMLGCAMVDSQAYYFSVLGLGLLMAVVGATQDHLIEAYRLLILPEESYKLGVSISLVAFRVGVMLAGGGGLVYASSFGWLFAYQSAALVMLCLAIVTLWAPVDKSGVYSVGTFKDHLDLSKRFFHKVLKDYGFMGVLLTHRLSIFWLEVMMPAFLMRWIGMTVFDIGVVYKFYGMMGLLLGGVLVNVWLDRERLLTLLYRSLWCQVLLCIAFLLVSVLKPEAHVWVSMLVFLECCLQGMLGTISTIWLMSKTDRQMPGFSFSLWYGFGALGRVFVGPLAVWVIEVAGWSSYMLMGLLLGCLSIVVCRRYLGTEVTEVSYLQA
jgi:MFS transporter, PAT family, beta-lactamase induction signal transducer AmpG